MEKEIVYERGYPVSFVLKGSISEAAGLQPGDRIYAINDQLVRTLSDYNRLAHGKKKVSIVRYNDFFEVELDWGAQT